MNYAQDLAEALNEYTGPNWAQEVPEIGLIDEEATRANGFNPDKMGDPNHEMTMLDGSRLGFTNGQWEERR